MRRKAQNTQQVETRGADADGFTQNLSSRKTQIHNQRFPTLRRELQSEKMRFDARERLIHL